MTHATHRFVAKATRALLPAAALALVCGHGHSQFTYSYSFSSSPSSAPADVAPFANCDSSRFVFVAGSGQVQRFNGTGTSGVASATAAIANPLGIAVNDIPGHCNYGKVYVTSEKYVLVLDWHLNVVKQVALAGSGFGMPNGIAVDAKGDVYVADTQNNLTYRLASSWFEAPFYISVIATADESLGGLWGLPLDVSVDHNYRAHVVNTCGCLTVYEPDGTLVKVGGAIPNVPGSVGVDALSPTADTFMTRVPNDDFVAWNWPGWPPSTLGALGSAYGASSLASPRGLEFQKFTTQTLLSNGRTRTYCTPSMFVADQGNNRTAVFTSPQLVSSPLPSGAVAWWRLEDRHGCSGTAALVRDAIGVNHGTSVGTATPRTVEGLVRCGLETEGQVRIRVPDAPALNFGTGSYSIEGWLRTEQATSTVTVLDKRIGGGAGYAVFLWNGKLGMQINDGGGFQNFVAANPLAFVADGTWHHFAVIVDRGADTASIHVDGVFMNSMTSLQPGSVTNAGALFLGARNDGGGIPLRGAIDEITLYDRVLTPIEVAAIYQAHCAGKDIPCAASSGFDSYGTGLAGSGGVVPTIAGLGCPIPGWPIGVRVDSALASTQGVLLFGTSNISFPIFGGTVLVLPTISVSYALDGTGSGTFNFVIPNDESLVGANFFFQSLQLDPGAAEGISFTDGLQVTVDDQ